VKKVPPISRLKEICQPQKVKVRLAERWYSPPLRKICIRITWFLAHVDFITPNSVTVFNIFLAILGGFVLLIPGLYGPLLYLFVVWTFVVLDGVDGELARFKKMQSPAGEYFDMVAHYTQYIGLYAPLGIKLFLATGEESFLVLSFSLIILIILANTVLFLKYAFINLTVKQDQADNSNTSWYYRIYRILINPPELSILIVVLLILLETNSMTMLYFWYAFFAFYILLYFATFIAGLLSAKKSINAV